LLWRGDGGLGCSHPGAEASVTGAVPRVSSHESDGVVLTVGDVLDRVVVSKGVAHWEPHVGLAAVMELEREWAG